MQPHGDINQHTPAAVAAVASSTLTTIAAAVLVGLSVRQQLVELYEHQLIVTITYLLGRCSSASEKIEVLAHEEATLHGNCQPKLHAFSIPSLSVSLSVSILPVAHQPCLPLNRCPVPSRRNARGRHRERKTD